MKPFICIGAALMATAGIYGFVDYKKTNHRQPAISVSPQAEKKAPLSFVKESSGLIAPLEKVPAVKKEPLSISEPSIKEEKKAAHKDLPLPGQAKIISKKKKDINYELFSRAPLEPYKEVMVEEPVKQKQ